MHTNHGRRALADEHSTCSEPAVIKPMPKAYNNAHPTMTYQPKHDRLEGGREGITMYQGREEEGATIGG